MAGGLAAPCLAALYLAVHTLVWVQRIGSETLNEDHLYWLSRVFYWGPWTAVVTRHNGHPKIIPNILYLLDWWYFDASHRLLFGVGLAMAVGVAALFAVALRGAEGIDSRTKIVTAAALVALFSWPGQPQSLFWSCDVVAGWPVFLLLMLAGTMFCRALELDPRARAARSLVHLACACFFLAGNFFGAGMMGLPVLLAACLVLRRPWRWTLLVMGWCVAYAGYYLWVLPAEPGLTTTLPSLAPLARYVLRWLGGIAYWILVWTQNLAESGFLARVIHFGIHQGPLFLGAVYLTGFVATTFWRAGRTEPRPCRLLTLGLLLWGFGVAVAIQIGIARTVGFPGSEIGIRFGLWRSIMIAGVVLVLAQLGGEPQASRRRRGICLAALGVLPFLLLATQPSLIRFWQRMDDGYHEEVLPHLVYGLWARWPPPRREPRADGMTDHEWFLYQGRGWYGRPDLTSMGTRLASRLAEAPGVVASTEWTVTPGAGPEGGARLEGAASLGGVMRPPRSVVVTDPEGIVRGLAVACRIDPGANRRWELAPHVRSRFVGFLEDHDPKVRYRFHAVRDDLRTAVPFAPRLLVAPAPAAP